MKQDIANRRGLGPREGISQQAFGKSFMAVVEAGEDFHFLRAEAGHAALSAQQAREDAGEAGQGPDVSLPGRAEVDALVAPLLVRGFVFARKVSR